jgi:hypothetical protein
MADNRFKCNKQTKTAFIDLVPGPVHFKSYIHCPGPGYVSNHHQSFQNET